MILFSFFARCRKGIGNDISLSVFKWGLVNGKRCRKYSLVNADKTERVVCAKTA